MTRSLNDVAKDLKELARGDTGGERAIQDLAAKLRRGDLAGVDIAGTYAPEVMLPDGDRWWMRATLWLELARDVLIFMPVVYTWWKISDALKAYGHYTGRDSFLLAWQEGFGNGTQRLSTSALVIALVVLGVVALTIVAHLLRDAYDRHVQQRQQRLAALLAEATLLSAQSLTAVPDVSKVELAKIGVQISKSAKNLQEALGKTSGNIVDAVNTSPGSKLHEMFEGWVGAANELKTLGTRLQGTQEVVQQLRETQTALTGMAEKLGAESERLLGAFAKEREVALQARHTHNQLASEVQSATSVLSEAMTGLAERAEQFNEMVLRLTFIVERLDGDGVRPRDGLRG